MMQSIVAAGTGKQTAVLAMLLFGFCSMAHAAITEIRKDFPAQTALLNNVPVIAAPSSTGEYLISGYLAQGPSSGVTASLSWTDENGTKQSVVLATPNSLSGSALLRVQAGTTPTVSTSGNQSRSYDLYLAGFGFWPGGKPGEGGIKRSANYSGWPASPVTLVNSAADADYYLLALAPDIGSNMLTLSWSDAQAARSLTINRDTGMAFQLIHTAAKSNVTLKGECQGSCPTATIMLINMGTPSAGPGPLIDHELYLERWTNATYPNQKTIWVQGAKNGIGLFIANITEHTSPTCNGETLYAVTKSLSSAVRIRANCDGKSYPVMFPAFLPAGGSAAIETQNWQGNPWGNSPTYSAEGMFVEF